MPPDEDTATSLGAGKTKKRKRSHILTQHVLARPRWCYLTLVPVPSSAPRQSLDAPTVRLALLRSLSSYLGDHGAAIPVDILAIDPRSTHAAVHVRVPHQDGNAVAAAIGSTADSSSAVCFRVKQRSDWLSGLVGGDSQELFDFVRDEV